MRGYENENETYVGMDGRRTSMRTNGTTSYLMRREEVPLSMGGDQSRKTSVKRTISDRKSE